MTEYKLSMGCGLEFTSYLSIDYARSKAYKKAVSGGPRTKVFIYRMDKKAIPRMSGYVSNQKERMIWTSESSKGKRIDYILNPDGTLGRRV